MRSSEPQRAVGALVGGAGIVLLAGRVALLDRVGHHDYLAGCALLADLLRQTPGLEAVVVGEGWPEDERVLEAARALVLYGAGGGKHSLLQSAQRVERIQRLVDRGVGMVSIHQAVSVPLRDAERVTSWLGGVHVAGASGRGHWRTHHRAFPAHPATRGVQPWKTRDGWLNEIRFADAMAGVTPLAWSGRRHRGSSAGGAADVVCWAYERAGGGRSFCFTGLDAHETWSFAGVRQLVVNGVLWSAGLEVPPSGAPCAVESDALRTYLTPRRSPGVKRFRKLVRAIGRSPWSRPATERTGSDGLES